MSADFEGPETKIKEVITYRRTSIPRAEVKLYHVDWKEPTGKYDDFEIRY